MQRHITILVPSDLPLFRSTPRPRCKAALQIESFVCRPAEPLTGAFFWVDFLITLLCRWLNVTVSGATANGVGPSRVFRYPEDERESTVSLNRNQATAYLKL